MGKSIYVVPGDLGGCGRYRMAWPAQAAKAARPDLDIRLGEGADTVETLGEDTFDARGRRNGHQAHVVTKLPDCDVLVLQRVTSAALATAIPLIQALGVRVVIDIDDDLTCIPTWNQAHLGLQPATDSLNNWRHLLTACQHADLVTCTTEELAARYAPHGRVEIIRNCIPEQVLNVTRQPRDFDATLLGWTGTYGMHAGDLPVVGNGIRAAMRAHGNTRFRVVGRAERCDAPLGLPPGMIEHTGWLDYANYYTAYGQLDVAIVPLEHTPFNRAKSELKGLEAAAVGVPFVATNTPAYRLLRRSGVGVLADRPKEWEKQVGRLLGDPVARTDLAEAGRAFAATRTIEGNVSHWVDAWLG